MKQKRRQIAVIPGDGIGIQVIEEGCKLLDFLSQHLSLNLALVGKDWGAKKWLKEKIGLPQGALEDLKANYDAIYFGALGDPQIPDMAHGKEILLGLRQGLDLYVNYRPFKLLDEKLTPLKNKQKEDINCFFLGKIQRIVMWA